MLAAISQEYQVLWNPELFLEDTDVIWLLIATPT
jgi:hypothetical protein